MWFAGVWTNHPPYLDQNGEHGVDVPPLTGTELVGHHQSIGHNVRLELGLGHLQEGEDLLHDGADVVLVDESKG